jgi:TolB-like protein/Tfp pilus assembly protein PilF
MEIRAIPPEAVSAALGRVSASKTFARAERHRSLLRHLVEKTVSGRSDEIKESTLALEVFGRDSYDPQIDSQVRVEVAKLRSRLERYYAGEGSEDAVRIEIPKGHYEPVFHGELPTPDPVAPPNRHPRMAWLAFSVVVAGALLLGVWLPHRSPAMPFRPGIAVMPFEDLSAAHDQEYFCSGINEELISDLNALQIFRVLPRSSVRQYRGRPADPRQVGRDLGVQAMVEGSVRTDGDRFRVSVRLVDTREGFQIWSDTYDHAAGNLLETQREIAGAVAKSFHMELPETRLALVRRRPQNSEAYLHYLRASYYYSSEPSRAVEFYRAAVAADPSYASAWAGLAASWNRLGEWLEVPFAKAREEAIGAADRAIALDPQLAEAQYAWAVTRLYYLRDWRAADQAFRKAAELDPMNTDIRWDYARMILANTGRYREAEDLLRVGIAIEPYREALQEQMAATLIREGRAEAALPYLDEARRIAAHAPSPLLMQAIAAHGLGRFDEALRKFQEVLKMQRTVRVLGYFGFTLATVGRASEARAMIDELTARTPIPEYEVAAIYAGLGQKDRALTGLESAVRAFAHSTLWMKADYRFESLRGDARFAGLLRSVGLE